eukprot:3176663-Pleurochrysis_carterae.AAC.1
MGVQCSARSDRSDACYWYKCERKCCARQKEDAQTLYFLYALRSLSSLPSSSDLSESTSHFAAACVK